MSEKNYLKYQDRYLQFREIYRLHVVDGLKVCELVKKTGISTSGIYRAITTFESDNPVESEMMKKKSKEILPEDYQKLLDEICSLKKDLSEERLRADFYEEMVSFGKEVYSIDLKKAGTK